MKPRRGVSLGAIAFLRACGVRLWGWMEKSQGRDAACAPMARSPADRKGIKNQGKTQQGASKCLVEESLRDPSDRHLHFQKHLGKSQADEKPYLEIRLRYFFVRENHVACGSARAALFSRMALEKRTLISPQPLSACCGVGFQAQKKNLWTSRHGEVPESSTPLSVPHCAPCGPSETPLPHRRARESNSPPRHARERRARSPPTPRRAPVPTPRPRSRPW